MKFNHVMIAMMLIGLMSCTVDKELREQLEGEWLLMSTTGGISGTGFTAEWNIINITDGDFELFQDFNDVLILVATGKIEEKIGPSNEELHNFTITKSELDEDIPLDFDAEKMIELDGDEMTWIAPCCDRYNYHFEKK